MNQHPLQGFHPATRTWFEDCFTAPTTAQAKAWPPIIRGESTLLLAPTGSGKTLAAFLTAIDGLMSAPPPKQKGCRVLYISPIKALGVDVERNLRAPLRGIVAVASRLGLSVTDLTVGVRSGDTPQSARQRMMRKPPDILITTPESLYLMLTSKAQDILRTVETVIIDEIHAVVPTKRGTHLALSLERLQALRDGEPLQRIGLSATQRPLEEVARFLGGAQVEGEAVVPRPVTIVDAGRRRNLDLSVEVPLEDMTDVTDVETTSPNAAMPGMMSATQPKSIWPAIHPRLLELIRAHRSTLLFVNSRRLAERLSAAINELAEEEIALAHHGSLAKEVRSDLEDRLKRGTLPAIIATSSLELGIDMGAIDLVIQLEAPPSVASGLQRIGRAGHQVGGISKGIIFPKYRGDLVACAAATVAMVEGTVESTRYPRNPLDVLAQQIVAIIGQEPMDVEALYDRVRGAAPYHKLPRVSFDGVLDMLSGRYPSDDFAELRPRLNWDRIEGTLEARNGAKRAAIINGGTIPDRGLFGVFLASGEGKGSRRVGELDEEMVFESRVGDVFVLGASTWRVEEITHDRVLVTPAPGEVGRMPFWRGDRMGRPFAFGQTIGALLRTLETQPLAEATEWLTDSAHLDEKAAKNLMAYLTDQRESSRVPTDRRLVLERFVDEIGDWRICLLSPFGSKVHAPWALVVRAKLMEERGLDVDAMWSDDGMVFRLPEARTPPPLDWFLPNPEELEEELVAHLSRSSVFAARFREAAGRALLLTRKRPGQRSPLWALRRRASSLLGVASHYREFPVILEAYRECLQDQFDLPSLQRLLRDLRSGARSLVEVEQDHPSPFANALLFAYVANYLYEGDVPLAERRAHALTIDHAQLKQLLGEAALRDLLDPEAIDTVIARVSKQEWALKSADDLHDFLRFFGDCDRQQLVARSSAPEEASPWIDQLIRHRRIVPVKIRGTERLIAAEDAARYRDGLGVVSPPGLPVAFLEPVEDALGDLFRRFARTHGPFTTAEIAGHFGLGVSVASQTLTSLKQRGRMLEGEFLPGGTQQEWCDPEVMRQIKRLSLAALRSEVEPVEGAAYARFLQRWHGMDDPVKATPDSVFEAVEQLQGAPLVASELPTLFASRLLGSSAASLDVLSAGGEIQWRGLGALGSRDGRVALYLADQVALLSRPPTPVEGRLEQEIRGYLTTHGSCFFSDLHTAIGGLAQDVLDALWRLVWAGEVSNDTLNPLRGRLSAKEGRKQRPGRRFMRGRRTRRAQPPGGEGRWSLTAVESSLSTTERLMAAVGQLLDRYGVLTRESITTEGLTGGFSSVYPILKALEEQGKIRRGYYVDGLGPTQFALPGADDALRSARDLEEGQSRWVWLAATDPASPYGASLPWPTQDKGRLSRSAGARVGLWNGHLLAYVSASGGHLTVLVSEDEPERSAQLKALEEGLDLLHTLPGFSTLRFQKVSDQQPSDSPLLPWFEARGFHSRHDGLVRRLVDHVKRKGSSHA